MSDDYECCASGSCEVCRRPSGYSREQRDQDEMDGNQNAEPRWSANRLEEVLREGLPDQNAEPEAER